jgi:Protein of unknown function (DUF2865)
MSIQNSNIRRISAGLLGGLVVALAGLPTSASAQGLFDTFFGNIRPAAAHSPVRSYAPTDQSIGYGRSVTFCVRLCDGRHFPLQHHGAAAAQTCNAFCPASATKTFTGSAIGSAVAADGTRYARLANAFVYRTKIVPDCTCNGKDSFGLAPLPISADTTMRPGDIVATGSVTAVKPTESKHSTRQVKTTFANR